MTELDARVTSGLRSLAEVVSRHDSKLGEAMKITTKDYELRALLAATVHQRHIYWYVEKLSLAQIAIEQGDEATAARYLHRSVA